MNAPIDRKALERLAAATLELKKRQLKKEFSRPGGLIKFVRHFWCVLEPQTPFVDGWVVEGMCEHLEAVTNGQIKRLLINVPPGFMKSLLVNVFWPAWEWACAGLPHLRYVSFSYSASLTERDNARLLDLIRSPEFQQLYGKQLQLRKQGETKISNTATGWKLASSVGGVGTGERGNRVLLDDPHNVKESESETIRTETVRWFRESMQNRLNSLADDAIIVIMQRVHEADVSGCILENYPDYEHFCVPMEYETGRHCSTCIGWSDPRSEEGELAWPDRYPDEILAPFRRQPFMWAGQYLQAPEPRGGGILKRDYWRLWDEAAARSEDIKPHTYPAFEYVVGYFDGAFSQKMENDPSALTIWGVWTDKSGRPMAMLVAAWQKWVSLHGVDIGPQFEGETGPEYLARRMEKWGAVEHIVHTCEKFRVDRLLIEAKANGIDVAREIQRLYHRKNFVVQLDNPGKLDKVARAHAVQDLFAEGIVWRPGSYEGDKDIGWALEVEDQCARFPKGKHDDLVDCCVGALRYLRKCGYLLMRDEAMIAKEEAQFPTAPMRKPLHYHG